jgi:Family of unknown function (DUF6527)
VSRPRVRQVRNHDGSDYGRSFVCPGCVTFYKGGPDAHPLGPDTHPLDATHVIPTTGPKAWGYNGNDERPSFTPSFLAHEVKLVNGSVFSPRCHSVITDGRIAFQSDCGHALAGQTVDLPELDD